MPVLTPTQKLSEIAQQSLALKSVDSAPTINSTSASKTRQDPFEVFTDQELLELLEEIDERKKWMEIECTLYERFLMKAGRGTRGGSGSKNQQQQQQQQYQQQQQLQGNLQQSLDTNPNLQQLKREVNPDCAVHIKIDIVNKEMEELKDEQSRVMGMFEKEKANLEAQVQELEQRHEDIEAERQDFKKRIEEASFNPRTNRVMAERVMRYFEDQLRDTDNLIEKTRLKNQSLHAQRARLLIQLRQKEETGEILQAIDYDQLSIENQQYQQKIEEKNAEMVKLKGTCAMAVSTLTTEKSALSDLVAEHDQLLYDISSRKEILKKLSSESKSVSEETERVTGQNTTMAMRMDEYRVPEIIDYVNLKARQMDLEQQVSAWQRKVEVHKMTKQRVMKVYLEAFPPASKFDKERNSAYTIASAKPRSRETAKVVKLDEAIAPQHDEN